MISGSAKSGGLDDLMRYIGRFKSPDLVPLGLDIKAALIQGNREGLLAGTDADGKPMAELADSTYRRGRGGLGPPLVPRFAGSQLIDRFKVDVEPGRTGGLSIRAGWPGVPQVRFFKAGTKHMPRRNPSGIRPETRQKIAEAVKRYKQDLLKRR